MYKKSQMIPPDISIVYMRMVYMCKSTSTYLTLAK